jgi:hypothetical protein
MGLECRSGGIGLGGICEGEGNVSGWISDAGVVLFTLTRRRLRAWGITVSVWMRTSVGQNTCIHQSQSRSSRVGT